MGEKLTNEETAILNTGKCPDCGTQLYKGPRGGGAMNVRCENKHLFWVAPPFTPERLYTKEVTNMAQSYNLPQCPYCYSKNVEPVGPNAWHCGDCGKDFGEAVVEQAAPPEKKGGKK